jgi:hypothetical protein
VPKVEIYSEAQLKDILFEMVGHICWGAASTSSSLDCLYNVGRGHYYTISHRVALVKTIEMYNPELYTKLTPFLWRNKPEGWDETDEDVNVGTFKGQ